MNMTQKSRPDTLIGTGFFFAILQLSYVFYSFKYKADRNSRNVKHQKQHCRSRALSVPEKRVEKWEGTCFHKRFKHPVNKESAEEISEGDSEKPESVTCGINTSLHFRGNAASENDIIIRTHQRDNAPAEKCTDAPYDGYYNVALCSPSFLA